MANKNTAGSKKAVKTPAGNEKVADIALAARSLVKPGVYKDGYPDTFRMHIGATSAKAKGLK